jgi:hypothetical protein
MVLGASGPAEQIFDRRGIGFVEHIVDAAVAPGIAAPGTEALGVEPGGDRRRARPRRLQLEDPVHLARLGRIDDQAAVLVAAIVIGAQALARTGSKEPFLYAFDLLELDGQDLRRSPWESRRNALAKLLDGAATDGIRLSEQYLPSEVETLIIMTQADLPQICRIYESVVQAHLAAGIRVITYSPEIGTVRIAQPARPADPLTGRVADVLVVPRVRRTTMHPAYLLMSPALRPDQVAAMAALRLDPSDEGLSKLEVRAQDLLDASRRRVMVEGLARSVASEYFTASAWRDPAAAGAQLAVIERLVDRAHAMSDDPLKRRAMLYRLLYGELEAPEAAKKMATWVSPAPAAQARASQRHRLQSKLD